MKYIIDIPNSQEYSYDKDFKSLDLRFHDDNFSGMTRFDAEPYTEPDRKAIEDEVWGFVKKIECLTIGETEDCFDVEYEGIPFVANVFSFQEAKDKYEKWLKQKEKIRVGDEVFHKDYPTYKAVVTKLYQSGCLCAEVLFSDGMTDKEIIVSNLIKTGRHFPEVAELLEKMRGDSE